MKRLIVLVVAVILATGCSERFRFQWEQATQWHVRIVTDVRSWQMADRLRIDVLDEAGNISCEDCSREFKTSEYLVYSFAVAATDNLVRVRARFLRAASGVVEAAPLVDVVGRLPERGRLKDEEDVTFAVPFGCFGRPPSLEKGTTCQPNGREVFDGPEPTLSTTVPPLEVGTTCAKDAPEGMACIGFGTFLLGDERRLAIASDLSAKPEIPVRIASNAALFIDKDEVTVGTVRRLIADGKVTPTDVALLSVVRRDLTGGVNEKCNYLTATDSLRDRQPMNCIGRDLASLVCVALGKRLPSEAEWEFAAGNGTAETAQPWSIFSGDVLRDDFLDTAGTVCDTAILGRGRPGFPNESRGCIELGTDAVPGPIESGSAADVTQAGVANMGGNLGEWVSDETSFYDEPCHEPFSSRPCKTATNRLDGRWALYRGGSWERPAFSALANSRFVIKDGAPSPYVGFRCAITEDELP